MELTCKYECDRIQGEWARIRREEYASLRLDHWLLDVVVRRLTAGGRELHDILRDDPEYRDWLSVANPEFYRETYAKEGN